MNPPFTQEQEVRMRQIFRQEISYAKLGTLIGISDDITRMVLSDRYMFEKLIQIRDGRNMQFGRSVGTKIGTAADQKIGLFGVTPVVQPTRPTDTATLISTGTALGLWA